MQKSTKRGNGKKDSFCQRDCGINLCLVYFTRCHRKLPVGEIFSFYAQLMMMPLQRHSMIWQSGFSSAPGNQAR